MPNNERLTGASDALVALVGALGAWPFVILVLGAFVVFCVFCAFITLIILRSRIAIEFKDSKGNWHIRFVRIEQGGEIRDLPVFSESSKTPPADKTPPAKKSQQEKTDRLL